MKQEISAVMLDVAGIQNYIFSTNMLRQNLGASYIVEYVMSEAFLAKVMTEIELTDYDQQKLEEWRSSAQAKILGGAEAEIAYTGGGNAVLMIRDQEKAEQFGKAWTRKVITEFPGLKPAAGLCEQAIESEASFKSLFLSAREALNESKALNHTVMDVPRYGFTANCIYTGDSAQYHAKLHSKEKAKYHSYAARKKYDIEEEGFKALTDKFRSVLIGSEFPRDFNEIGGGIGKEARIAVVHIDGNNMGKQFSGIEKLEDYRKKSIAVNEVIRDAVGQMIGKLLDIQRDHEKELPGKGRSLLFRPVIMSGDDITYVIYGDLGVWSAVEILKAIRESDINKNAKDESQKIAAAAGIVITKPSFPFSQSYQLAEELMGQAKKRFRDKPFTFSLNYFEQIGGALAENVTDEPLYNRPFELFQDGNGFDILIEQLKAFRNYPKNKQKELRELTYQGEDAINRFKNHLRTQRDKHGKSYADIDLLIEKKEASNRPCYLDLIEFADISPEWLDSYFQEKENK
jgi:hypothetical protein